jgi:hypothetical protein
MLILSFRLGCCQRAERAEPPRSGASQIKIPRIAVPGRPCHPSRCRSGIALPTRATHGLAAAAGPEDNWVLPPGSPRGPHSRSAPPAVAPRNLWTP